MKEPRNTTEIIMKAVAKTLPPGKTFSLMEEPINLKGRHILRIITPAWKTMDKMDRFAKMQDAILPELTPLEKKRIFRISVLTPAEWLKIGKDRPKAKVLSLDKTSRTANSEPAGAVGKTSGSRKLKPSAISKHTKRAIASFPPAVAGIPAT